MQIKLTSVGDTTLEVRAGWTGILIALAIGLAIGLALGLLIAGS